MDRLLSESTGRLQAICDTVAARIAGKTDLIGKELLKTVTKGTLKEWTPDHSKLVDYIMAYKTVLEMDNVDVKNSPPHHLGPWCNGAHSCYPIVC